MAPIRRPPRKRQSTMQLYVKWIHERYLANRTFSEPFCYGGMKAFIKRLGPLAAKRLEAYYVHAYGLSLRVAIRRRFRQYPGYAKKLNAMLQGRNPKAARKAAWPAKSRAIAAKRLGNTGVWPKKLPPNIRIYKTSQVLYRPFRSWGEWYLLNYDVLQGGALSKAGIHVSRPRSPFPDSVNDPDYGDLEFFKDLHATMTAAFRRYTQKCDKGIWDPFFTGKSDRAKGRVAWRCLPLAQRLEALFKTANKGQAAKNMLHRLRTEIQTLKDWKKRYPR